MPHEPFPGLDPSRSPAWQGDRVLDDRVVPVVVWLLEAGHAPATQLASAAALVRDLESFDAKARAFLASDADAIGSETRTYLEHHLEELAAEELEGILGEDIADVDVPTFCSALRLVRVSIQPAREQTVLDYSIGTNLTDYVLAVTIPSGDGAWRVDMES